MERKLIEGIEYRMCKELEDLHGKKDWTPADVLSIFHMTGAVKNLKKIEEIDMGFGMDGHSQAGKWRANMEGDYGHGNSYGRHWVKGHYSRDDGSSYNGNSYNGSSYNGDASMHDGRLANRLQEMLSTASNDRERELIRRFMNEARNM